nr:MAG TPA: hypothetical protein [Caudoviricetes sp.]
MRLYAPLKKFIKKHKELVCQLLKKATDEI